MRRVHLNGAPPQDWVEDANTVSAQLHAAAAITIAANASVLRLMPGLHAKAELPAAVEATSIIGEIGGKIHVRIFGTAGILLADVEEPKKLIKYSCFHLLHQILENNWDDTQLKPLEVTRIFELLTAIVREFKVDAIIEANEDLWRDNRIRNWLLSQFNHKCWYSEARESVSPFHVDHFRPKGRITDDVTGVTSSGYWWLAFVWSNYKVCGELINVKKRDVFPFFDDARGNPNDIQSLGLESPVLIDPRTNEARLISYEWEDEETCVATPATGNLAYQVVKADRTIEILGLNRLASLNRKRADFWDDCMIEISNWNGATGSPALAVVAQAAVVARLKRMIDYNSEFSSVVEACLFKKGPDALKSAVFGQGPVDPS
jgi:hypothetical protein